MGGIRVYTGFPYLFIFQLTYQLISTCTANGVIETSSDSFIFAHVLLVLSPEIACPGQRLTGLYPSHIPHPAIIFLWSLESN